MVGCRVLRQLAWCLFASALVTQVAVFSTTIFLHRCATHKALELHPAVAFVFRFWLWLTTGLCTREWVAVHRKHHAFTEVEGDPHSPHLQRLLVGAARQRLSLPQGSEESGDARALRAGHRGGCLRPGAVPVRIRRAGAGHRRAVLRAGSLVGTACRGRFICSCTCSCCRRRSTVCATTSATGTSTTPPPTSGWSRCSPAGKGCTTTITGIRAVRSSAFARSEIDPSWPLIRLLIALRLAHPYKTIDEIYE